LEWFADYPEAYEGQPGFEFIKEVPTVWNETKVLDAKVGEYILIARRKNTDWFIGAITNHTARKLDIPLSFIANGNYAAEIYTDAPDVIREPNHLIKLSKEVTNKDVLSFNAASGGGGVIHLKMK